MLEAIGVTELEEGVYRVLLARPRATADEIAQSLGAGPDARIEDACRSLEASGLVSRVPGEPPQFVATRPDVAVEVLVLRRQEELERIRLAAVEMLDQFRGATRLTSPAELVEIVTSREAVHQRFLQLERGATTELLVFDKPPYTAPLVVNEIELELLGSGVACKTLYARGALELEGALDVLEALASAGEQARVLPTLPMKMAIADRRQGLVPLSLDAPGMEEGGLILHSSALLEALTSLFDALWERATPIGLDRTTPGGDGEDGEELSALDRRLLALVAAGLKDEGIARQLGIGVRTVRRHISDLVKALGAETRFQAGLKAGKRGWL